MIINIAPTTADYVRELGKTMREADQDEIKAAGYIPHRILWQSYRLSVYTRTALVDGVVAAIWGVCGNIFERVGTPWLLTAPACELVSPLVFARIYKGEAEQMLEIFPHLVNIVDARYTRAIRLLKMTGFHLDDPQPYGKEGALFRRFSMEA